MTVFKHEWRQGRLSFLIWTASIASLMIMTLGMFPEMKGEMDSVGNVFASMGSFTSAFGMDRLNFGTLVGFYAIECGNVLGLGGAMFAALLGITALSKEEKEHTAEFLFTHPVSRARIIIEKLLSVLCKVTLMNVIVFAICLAMTVSIGEEVPWKEFSLMHTAYWFMQIEIAGICFGISAFLRKAGVGIGLGFAIVGYFFNIISNLSESADFLKYFTPFAYCEAADIVTKLSLDWALITIGMAVTVLFVAVGYIKYIRKDICS